MNTILSDLKNISFRDLDYKEIGLWPLRLRQLILIVFSVLLLLIGSRQVIQNRTAFKYDAEKEITRLQEQIQQQYQSINQLPQYQQQVKKLQDIIQERLLNVPDRNQIGASIEQISRSGSKNNITFQSITPGTIKEDLPLNSVPITINFSGQYDSIFKFLSELAQTKIIMAFQSVSIDIDAAASKNSDNSSESFAEPSLNVIAICNIFWKPELLKKT